MFAEPRLECYSRSNEVLGGASNSTRRGSLPSVSYSVSGVFGGDGASSDTSHFAVGFVFNWDVNLWARFMSFGIWEA